MYLWILGDSDVNFRKGANSGLEIALKEKPDIIILKSRSPSCGVREIYDGTFTGTKIPDIELMMAQNDWQKSDIFERIAKSKFRSRFKLKDKDIAYVKEKGMDKSVRGANPS